MKSVLVFVERRKSRERLDGFNGGAIVHPARKGSAIAFYLEVLSHIRPPVRPLHGGLALHPPG